MRIKKTIQDVLRRNEPGGLTLSRVIAELRSMRSPASTPRLVLEISRCTRRARRLDTVVCNLLTGQFNRPLRVEAGFV